MSDDDASEAVDDDGEPETVAVPVDDLNALLRCADWAIDEVSNGRHYHGADAHEARENAQRLAGAAERVEDLLGDDADALI